jgi:two-component system, OmpR family, response regulator
MIKVLVIDDEAPIRLLCRVNLEAEGMSVIEAADGPSGVDKARDETPDVILLDVMMPGLDGWRVAEELIEDPRTAEIPIIFLTARDATADKVRGLTLGGDDYVTKPFSLEELIARIRTVLRRTGNSREQSSRLAFEDLQLDDETREVARGGVPIELTATEYRLLRYLLTNPRRVLTREQILNHVWDYDFAGDARVLETYVSYLRKKLDVHGQPLIHTVRGVGYALRAPRS